MANRDEFARCRANLRQMVMPHVVYTPVDAGIVSGVEAVPPPVAAQGLPGDALCAVTLLEGMHFRTGATHWRDLNKTSAELVACVLNAAAHVNGTKPPSDNKNARRGSRSGQAQAATERARAVVIVETLLSPKDRAGARIRRVRGYRLWVTFQAVPAAAPAAAANAPAAAADATSDDQAPGAAAAAAPGEVPALARGLEASYREARVLRQRAERASKPLEHLLPYRFASAADNAETFHYNVVARYLDRALDSDPRPWSNAMAAAATRMPLSWTGHPYNPAALLSKETAMAYTRAWSLALEQPLADEQTTLASYVPGATGVPPTEAAEQDLPPEHPELTWFFATDGSGAPRYPDTATPTWPFPSVTYAVGGATALAEVMLPYVRLPFVVGKELTADAWAANAAREGAWFEPVANLRVAVAAIEKLRAIEAADPGDSSASGPGVVFESGTERQMGMRMLPIVNEPRTMAQVIAEYDAPEAPPAGFPHVMTHEKRVQREQMEVVRRAVGVLTSHYRTCAYREFAAVAPELLPSSSHTDMALREFLYTAQELDPAGSLSSLRFVMDLQAATAALGGDSREAQQSIAASVDIFPAWQTSRNAFLQERQRRQLARASLDYKHRVEQANWKREHELLGDQDAAAMEASMARLQELLTRHGTECRELMTREFASFDRTFRTTTLASDAFLAARDHMVKTYMPTAVAPAAAAHDDAADDGGTRLATVIHGRPYRLLQQYINDVFVSVEKVANQNLPYTKRAYTSIFQAHRFKARRGEPALNYVIAGPSGAGKSFAILAAAFMAPPGVVENITTMTTAAMNVDKDFDGTAYVQEEVDSAFLFTDQKSKDAGANDKANYMKARTTSFCTVTQYFFHNEETGQREARKCYSSQHIVYLGATNQNLKHMDKAVGRRLAIDLVGEDVLDSDGGKAGHMGEFEIFKRYAAEKNAQNVLRELHCAYIYVEKAIQAGVMDDVLEDGAKVLLDNIMRFAHDCRGVPLLKTTKAHWILEAARTYAILDRCYFALFSEAAHTLYRGGAAATGTEAPIRRWTWRMFQKLVEPGLFTGKEHVLDALGAFDFLIAPRAEHQLLHTLATKVCRLGEPVARWPFAHNIETARGVTTSDKYDYNYFALQGASRAHILQRLGDLNKDNALMRAEDLDKLLDPYEKLVRDTRTIEPVWQGANNAASPMVALVYNTSPQQVPKPRTAIAFWTDPQAPLSNKSARQLVISVDFILNYFGLTLDMPPEAMRERLALVAPLFDAALFTRPPAERRRRAVPGADHPAAAQVRRLAECPPERSALMEAARHCLCNRVLERSPYEDAAVAPVAPEAFVYHTFYTPDPVRLRLAPPPGAAPASIPPLRVPMHGTNHVLTLARNPDGPLLWNNHYNRPLPSASVTIFGAVAGAVDDETRGFYMDDYDVDYIMARHRQQRSGDTGLRAFEALAVRSWARDSGADEAAVRDALPPMSAEEPMQWAFGALATRIAHQAAVEAGLDAHFLDYPCTAMIQRLTDTAERSASVLDGTMAAYRSYSELMDPLTAFRRQQQRKRQADAEITDASMRPPPRQRPRAVPAITDRLRPHLASAPSETVDAMDITNM